MPLCHVDQIVAYPPALDLSPLSLLESPPVYMTPRILYRDQVSAGKWSDAEEQALKEATSCFQNRTLLDCAEGESFVTYIAAHMNCPVSRILNKLLDKPVLKTRYSVDSEEFVERWCEVDIEALPSLEETLLTSDFDSLLQMEQERFLEFSANATLGFNAHEALIERDREFNRRIQKVLKTNTTCRKKRRKSCSSTDPSTSVPTEW